MGEVTYLVQASPGSPRIARYVDHLKLYNVATDPAVGQEDSAGVPEAIAMDVESPDLEEADIRPDRSPGRTWFLNNSWMSNQLGAELVSKGNRQI